MTSQTLVCGYPVGVGKHDKSSARLLQPGLSTGSGGGGPSLGLSASVTPFQITRGPPVLRAQPLLGSVIR